MCECTRTCKRVRCSCGCVRACLVFMCGCVRVYSYVCTMCWEEKNPSCTSSLGVSAQTLEVCLTQVLFHNKPQVALHGGVCQSQKVVRCSRCCCSCWLVLLSHFCTWRSSRNNFLGTHGLLFRFTLDDELPTETHLYMV